MKILILANNDAGLFKFRKELLEELVKHYQVYISVPEGEFVPDIKALGCRTGICRFLDRRGTNPFHDIKLLLYYSRLLKKIRPDLVFTYTIKPNVYGGLACRKYHVPYVANITGLGTAVENGGILQKITLFLYKAGLRNARKVFFQNTENRDFFLKFGREYIKRVFNADRLVAYKTEHIKNQYKDYQNLMEQAGSNFVPEGMLYLKYALEGKRYYCTNETLGTVHETEESLSHGRLTREKCRISYWSYSYNINNYVHKYRLPFTVYCKFYLYMVKFGLLLGKSMREIFNDMPEFSDKILLFLMLPFGVGNFILGKKIEKQEEV